MMRNLKTICLVLFLTLMCLLNVGAEAKSPSSEAKKEQNKKYDLSFAVSADALVQKIKQDSKTLIIDVRSPQEYNKIHIPGAISAPLHAIKTKTFLIASHLVLVDNGYAYSQLAEECINLKKNGFHVSILWGGLNAWKESAMDFEGDVFAAREFDRVSPQNAYRENGFEGRAVIYVSSEPSPVSKQVFPGVKHIKDLNVNTLKKMLAGKGQESFSTTLILNADGKGYEKFEETVKKAGARNVFYLSGGLNEYAKFVKTLSLSKKPGEKQVEGVKKCVKCGE